jgi:hypothetical protein
MTVVQVISPGPAKNWRRFADASALVEPIRGANGLKNRRRESVGIAPLCRLASERS